MVSLAPKSTRFARKHHGMDVSVIPDEIHQCPDEFKKSISNSRAGNEWTDAEVPGDPWRGAPYLADPTCKGRALDTSEGIGSVPAGVRVCRRRG